MALKGRIHRAKKQGMEIQATFLVVIIISIVIFGSGLYLVKKFFTATSAFQDQIDENTAKEIERRLAESGEKVSIPINLKKFSVGETKVFGLGILNTLTPDTRCQVGGQSKPCNRMGVVVKFISAVDYQTQIDNDETKQAEPNDIEAKWIPSSFPPIEVTPNQLRVVSIPVNVANLMKSNPPISTRRGTIYIFNVCVFNKYEQSLDSGNANSCRIGTNSLFVQNQLYGSRIIKMLVHVV